MSQAWLLGLGPPSPETQPPRLVQLVAAQRGHFRKRLSGFLHQGCAVRSQGQASLTPSGFSEAEGPVSAGRSLRG